jgi:hypothetical protein
MHNEAGVFLESAKIKYPSFFKNTNVVEFGSRQVCGSPRFLFENCNYVGVDVNPGECVDIVSLAHEYQHDGKADVVISTEMLEHDMFWQSSLMNMVNILRPSGLLMLTAGGLHRMPHSSCFTIPIEWENYYRNISVLDLVSVLKPDVLFSQCMIQYNDARNIHGNIGSDIYFYGIKRDMRLML